MNSPGKSDTGPDAISMIASVGAPLVVAVMLLCRVMNGHWESVVFVGLIFLVVLIVYVRIFWHDKLDDADMPPDDAGLTSSEVENSS